MSLPNNPSRTDHVENGVTTVFPFDFKIFSEADLVVISRDQTTLVETVLTLGVDYTVSGVNAESGSITKVAGTSGDGLTIKRVVEIAQPVVLRNQSDFFPATHEKAFDRIVMQNQQQQEEIGRCLKLSEADTNTILGMTLPDDGFALGRVGNRFMGVPNAGADQLAYFANATDPSKGAGAVGFDDALAYGASTVGGALKDRIVAADLADAPGAGLVGFDTGDSYSGGTVGADLLLPRPVDRGGTGAASVAGALANLGLIDLAAEVTITSSVAMDSTYLNKSVVCASAGAFYSPVLPASAPVGSQIFVRISMGMTFLVVLTAPGGENIDGAASRIMWMGESALLVKTSATTWTKVLGRTIPMAGSLIRTSNQSISTGSTFVPIDFTTADSTHPTTAFCFDTGNGRFRAGRPGKWYVKASIPINITNPTSIGNLDGGLCLSSAALTTQPNSFETYPLIVSASQQRWTMKPSGIFTLGSGGYVEVIVRAQSTAGGFAVESITPTIDPSLSFMEIPTW